MAQRTNTDEIKERLREVEEDLTFLRGELGPRTDDPQDYGDAAADLESRAEQAAQIEILEAERDRLKAALQSH